MRKEKTVLLLTDELPEYKRHETTASKKRQSERMTHDDNLVGFPLRAEPGDKKISWRYFLNLLNRTVVDFVKRSDLHHKLWQWTFGMINHWNTIQRGFDVPLVRN